MTHLLTGSDQEFEEAAQRWAKSGRPCNRNAFGQSALHLAVILPQRLKKLLELGISPDAVDCGNTTPLMYAATYGKLESVLDLIDHGSEVGSQDTLNQRFFVDYIMAHGHLNLLTDLVRWLQDQSDSELALLLIDRCIWWTFAQSSSWPTSDTLDCLFRLRGDSDVIVGSKTSMHAARSVQDAHVVLQHKFTAVEVVDEDGETALMRVSRFRDTRLFRAVLKLEADAGISIDRQDSSGWTALMHLVNCMDDRNSHQLEETQHLHRTSAVGCLNMLLSHGAGVNIADQCNCPCSPNGCSALSIAMHRAVESTSLFDHSRSISRKALDFAIALRTCINDDPQWTIDAAKTFVDFLETGRLHTCCARRRVRSNLWPPPSDCSTSTNARTHVEIASSAGTDQSGGLRFELARLYNISQRRSQAQHDELLARNIKDTLVQGRERRVSGLVVDTIRDSYERTTIGSLPIPDVLHLDMDAFREWIAWCTSPPRQMYSRASLEAWVKEASSFAESLSDELLKLGRS
jgi:hypothetical protein